MRAGFALRALAKIQYFVAANFEAFDLGEGKFRHAFGEIKDFLTADAEEVWVLGVGGDFVAIDLAGVLQLNQFLLFQ